MNILVTGGLGFIGAHTVIELCKEYDSVVITDNLVNSKIETLSVLKNIAQKDITFYNYDVTDYNRMDSIFSKHNFDCIIHFAGFKSVVESHRKPLEYYKNNVLGTLVLAELTIKYKIKHFIFSSSATVYGNQMSPLKENMDLLETTNPYGETKVISERILKDIAKTYPHLCITNLRYFNPVGAHKSGLIGDNPNGNPSNLMPIIVKVASKELNELLIYGGDYETPDGTALRDYIHVVDLARGHIAAMKNRKTGFHIYNLGTGNAISVLEMVRQFEKTNSVSIPFRVVGRREGDLACAFADPLKAKNELNWETNYGIVDMVKDAWAFEKNKMNK